MAEQVVAKSLDDIASMMAANTMALREAKGQPAELPNQGRADEPVTEVADETADESVVDAGATGDAGDEGTEQPVEAGGDDEQDAPEVVDDEAAETEDALEGAAENEFQINDDDLMELDEETQVSVAELKAAYLADKTIATRLAESQDNVVQTRVQHQKAIQDAEKINLAAATWMEKVVEMAAVQYVSMPDESLKTSNPGAYIEHLDAFHADQARIASSKKSLMDAAEATAAAQKEALESRRQIAVAEVQQQIPAMQNELTRKQASQEIYQSAEYYGFKAEDVNAAADSRLYRMAYDAMQYRKLMDNTARPVEERKEELTTKVQKQPRTLRSRGTTAKNRLSAKAKEQRVLKTAAKKSGSVEDVAALLAARHK